MTNRPAISANIRYQVLLTKFTQYVVNSNLFTEQRTSQSRANNGK